MPSRTLNLCHYSEQVLGCPKTSIRTPTPTSFASRLERVTSYYVKLFLLPWEIMNINKPQLWWHCPRNVENTEEVKTNTSARAKFPPLCTLVCDSFSQLCYMFAPKKGVYEHLFRCWQTRKTSKPVIRPIASRYLKLWQPSETTLNTNSCKIALTLKYQLENYRSALAPPYCAFIANYSRHPRTFAYASCSKSHLDEA